MAILSVVIARPAIDDLNYYDYDADRLSNGKGFDSPQSKSDKKQAYEFPSVFRK